MLLAIETLHAVASAQVVTERALVFVLIEFGLVVPEFSLEDIHFKTKVNIWI